MDFQDYSEKDFSGRGPSIVLHVVDHKGQKVPVRMHLNDDVAILKAKILNQPWIHNVSPAWTIHGGTEPIIRCLVMDRYTGQQVERELKSGSSLNAFDVQSGCIVTPEYNCDAYTWSIFGQ